MKVTYILKKGLHHYPPCLAQVLYLKDLNVDIEVYHGEESTVINQILDERGIKHHILQSDRRNENKLQSMVTMYAYCRELRNILQRIPTNELIWFGNCESAMGAGNRLHGRNYVLSVLELYDKGSYYDRFLKKYIHDAKLVLCCEKHRAEIMRIYYGLKKAPYVLPNKPYELNHDLREEDLSDDVKCKITQMQGKTVVLYQGIITADRPLDRIAAALNNMNDPNICFAVLGRASKEMEQKLKGIYENTLFMGYVPSPQHLLITKYADIGIANYDFSCLNNLFCAPNKIYEYAKFGVPMLTSKNISLVETVGRYKCAECVDFSDVKRIEEGIKKIITNKEIYARNAIAFYEDCDNKAVLEKVIQELKIEDAASE